MVLILDGNSEVVAHIKNNLCHLICLRHLIESSHKSDTFFFFMRAQHVLSYHLPWVQLELRLWSFGRIRFLSQQLDPDPQSLYTIYGHQVLFTYFVKVKIMLILNWHFKTKVK